MISHTAMFRVRPDNGDTDNDLPGCRYFAVRSEESHLSGWVSEAEYRWLCEKFGIPLSDDEQLCTCGAFEMDGQVLHSANCPRAPK